MMYEEFLKIAKLTEFDMDRHEYDTGVEVVYMYHPAIRNVDGKQQVADLYRQGLILELLPRAKAIMDTELARCRAQLENRQLLDRFKEENIALLAKHRKELEDMTVRQANEHSRIQDQIDRARNDLAKLEN